MFWVSLKQIYKVWLDCFLMHYRKLLVGIAVTLLVLSIFAVHINIKQASAQATRGPASDVIYYKQITSDSAAMQAVAAGGDQGGTDIHFFRAPPNQIPELLNNPNIVVVFNKRGGYLSYILNPVPQSVSGKFNPFEYKEFRQGVQYIVKRETFAIPTVLAGYGSAWISPVAQYDYDWLNVADTVEKSGIRDDIQRGYQLMSDALSKAGATKGADGKWYFQGSPVSITIFIRNDDPVRNTLGEDLAKTFSDFGITVNKIYGDLLQALEVVYGSDPKELKWHIYTEGWGATALTKYSDGSVAQFYASLSGYMPGWAEPTFWNYKNTTIDDLANRLLGGNFTSEAERNELLNKAIRMGLEESVRIFLAEMFDAYVYNKRRVSGSDLVNEYAGGLANRFTVYNIKPLVNPDRPITIGVKYLSRGAFNPIGGLTDLYSVLLYYALSDPGLWRDPHSGNVIDWREKVVDLRSSTTPSIDVPADAIKWDGQNHKWVQVGPGLKAKSLVTYQFTFGKWHDGSMMNIYDILYGFYFLWEWSSKSGPDDGRFSSTYQSAVAPLVNQLVAIKPDPAGDKITIYLNYWHFDPDEIKLFIDPWTTVPFHILYAMENLYVTGYGSWYQSEATARNNLWLDPIQQIQAQRIKATLSSFLQANQIPDAFTAGWNATGLPQLTLDEARNRYSSAINFISTYNHAIITNGLFILAEYIPNNIAKLIANREDPLDPNKWKQFTLENLAKIDKIDYTSPPTPIPKGQDFNANVSISIANIGPAKDVDIRARYWVYDPSGNLAFSGDLKYTGTPGSFLISFPTSNLAEGLWSFKLYVVSKYALIPDIKTGRFLIGPSVPTTTPTPTPTPTTPPSPTPTTLPTLPTPPTPPTTPPPSPSPTPTPPSFVDIWTVLIIALAIIVVVALAVIFLRRPTKTTPT